MGHVRTLIYNSMDPKHPTNAIYVNAQIWGPYEPGRYTLELTCHATPTDSRKYGDMCPSTTCRSRCDVPDAYQSIDVPIQAKDDDDAIRMAKHAIREIFKGLEHELEDARNVLLDSKTWRNEEKLHAKLEESEISHKAWTITDKTWIQAWHFDGERFTAAKRLSTSMTYHGVPMWFTTVVRDGTFDLFEIMDCLMLSVDQLLSGTAFADDEDARPEPLESSHVD